MDQFEQQNAQPSEKKGNFGWGVLGFFFPIIGLILFLVWKNDKPADAKVAGIGALIGVIVSVVFSIIMIVVTMAGGGLLAGLLSGVGAVTIL